ncbi:putative ribosomal protein S12e [Helianthus anomalus]
MIVNTSLFVNDGKLLYCIVLKGIASCAQAHLPSRCGTQSNLDILLLRNVRKVVGCSCLVVKDYEEESEGLHIVQEYVKSH